MHNHRVLLVNPPLVDGIAFTRTGRCQEREGVLGTTKPPYSLAVLAAVLRKQGVDVCLVDQTADRVSTAQLIRHLERTAITALLAAGLSRFAGIHRLRPVGTAAAAVLVLILMALTWERSMTFSSEARLWQDSLSENPHSYNAHNNLGKVLTELGRPQEAIPRYQDALRMKPDFAMAHNNLGTALRTVGRPQEAIPHYQEALRIKPDYADAHNNWGYALALQGDWSEAVSHYEQALRLNPNLERARVNLLRAQEEFRRQNPGSANP